jgi:hypothetical protein
MGSSWSLSFWEILIKVWGSIPTSRWIPATRDNAGKVSKVTHHEAKQAKEATNVDHVVERLPVVLLQIVLSYAEEPFFAHWQVYVEDAAFDVFQRVNKGVMTLVSSHGRHVLVYLAAASHGGFQFSDSPNILVHRFSGGVSKFPIVHSKPIVPRGQRVHTMAELKAWVTRSTWKITEETRDSILIHNAHDATSSLFFAPGQCLMDGSRIIFT